MCGIAGFFDSKISNAEGLHIAKAMGHAQRHRGPDASDEWSNGEGLFFSHRRLSIVDLSAAGAQPMSSASGRYTISFNGEIYNHLSLRQDLPKFAWRGHSDTETLLEAIAFWGVEKTLDKIKGMFAFSLWDRQDKELTLARDRAGEKPLYYGWHGNVFLFSSELKAFTKSPQGSPALCPQAIEHFLKFGYIPGPLSIYNEIFKLSPGSFIKVQETELIQRRKPKEISYWSYARYAQQARNNLFQGSYAEAMSQLEKLFLSSVKEQMVADVPVGAFLSGGVDSSLTAAYMQSVSTSPIDTFTIGFEEKKYDESFFAAAVAKKLGTRHHELIVNEQKALELVPRIAAICDEPFADASLIPSYILTDFARQNVKVCLSGDAGDELFGGYSRYALTNKAIAYRKVLPSPLRKVLGTVASSATMAWPKKADRIERISRLLRAHSDRDVYLNMISAFVRPQYLQEMLPDRLSAWQPADPVASMMEFDFLKYLPDDILKKVDMASMAVSLEARVPLLDRDLVEFSLTLPSEFRGPHGQGKKILKDLLRSKIPSELVDRPKAGFGAPIEKWLRGSLKDWAHETLFTDLSVEFVDKYLEIDRMWYEHQAGTRNWSVQLWPILMLNSWILNRK